MSRHRNVRKLDYNEGEYTFKLWIIYRPADRSVYIVRAGLLNYISVVHVRDSTILEQVIQLVLRAEKATPRPGPQPRYLAFS